MGRPTFWNGEFVGCCPTLRETWNTTTFCLLTKTFWFSVYCLFLKRLSIFYLLLYCDSLDLRTE
jgi:hypothetical protein